MTYRFFVSQKDVGTVILIVFVCGVQLPVDHAGGWFQTCLFCSNPAWNDGPNLLFFVRGVEANTQHVFVQLIYF